MACQAEYIAQVSLGPMMVVTFSLQAHPEGAALAY
jgi:hypothetical protein